MSKNVYFSLVAPIVGQYVMSKHVYFSLVAPIVGYYNLIMSFAFTVH